MVINKATKRPCDPSQSLEFLPSSFRYQNGVSRLIFFLYAIETVVLPKITIASKHVIKTFERLVASLPALEQTKVSIEEVLE
jgi:hypothetical protein